MGIIEQLNKMARERPPEVHPGAEDKLEEWLGLVPEGSMPSKARKAVPTPSEPVPAGSSMVVSVKLAEDATDLCRPTDFKSSTAYAKKLTMIKARTSKGYYPGYIVTIDFNNIQHIRRICEPVKDVKQAHDSPEFVLAMTKGIQAIYNFKKS